MIYIYFVYIIHAENDAIRYKFYQSLNYLESPIVHVQFFLIEN